MFPKDKYYLKTGKASDLKDPKERFVYRVFEILPGALAWTTLLGVISLSWIKPIWVALFIIAFDVYWLLKTIYLSLHLRSSYFQMKKQMKIDWLEKIKNIKKKDWRDIYHLVILPFATEPEEVIRATFQSIISSDYPKDKIIVVLGTEGRIGQEAQETAEAIRKEFGHNFFKFLVTNHPDNIVG